MVRSFECVQVTKLDQVIFDGLVSSEVGFCLGWNGWDYELGRACIGWFVSG